MAEEILIEKKAPRYSSLQDYISVVFQHKWKGLIFFIIVTGVGVVLAAASRNLYESEANLLVRLGWESVNPDPTIATGERTGSINQSQALVMNTALNLLMSQSTAEQVVDKLGPERFMDPLGVDAASGAGTEGNASLLDSVSKAVRKVGNMTEMGLDGEKKGKEMSARHQAIGILMDYTEAFMVRNTNVISIGFTSPSPQLSQDVVRELTDRFLEHNRLVYRTPGSYEFVAEQEEEARGKVEKLEAEMQNLKKESGVVDWDQRLAFVETSIGVLRQTIAAGQSDLKAAEAKITDLRNRQSNLPEVTTLETTSMDYSVIDGLRTRILTLKGEEQIALSKFTRDSESVREICRQITEVEKQLSEEEPRVLTTLTQGINTLYQGVGTALNDEESLSISLKARLEESRKQLLAAEKEREDLIDLHYRFSRLALDLSKQKANYAGFLASLNQARQEQTLEEKSISNISVVQPATYPLSPTDSKRFTFLVVGLLGGMAGAIVLAFFCASMDHTFKTPEEVERMLQLPALVAIPRVRTNRVTLKAKLG